MSNITIKNSADFELVISKLESTLPTIREVFSSIDNNIDSINGTELWYGKTQDTLCKKYFEFRENYEFINNSFENYIKFLKIVLNDYKNAENKINSSIESNLKNLDVN